MNRVIALLALLSLSATPAMADPLDSELVLDINQGEFDDDDTGEFIVVDSHIFGNLSVEISPNTYAFRLFEIADGNFIDHTNLGSLSGVELLDGHVIGDSAILELSHEFGQTEIAVYSNGALTANPFNLGGAYESVTAFQDHFWITTANDLKIFTPNLEEITLDTLFPGILRGYK